MLINSGSLFSTTIVTSLLGFVYWWVAARRFTPEAVGIASASVSTMTLLGSFCIVGLGTLLITELPRQPGRVITLISTALVVVGAVGGCIGFLFALVAPAISSAFAPLRASSADSVIFAAGVSLTSITLVFDQALIGLLRGGLQLTRNTLFAIIKLVALLMVGFLLSNATGITVYTTWAIGSILSLVVIVIPALFKQRKPLSSYMPQWDLLRKLGPAAVQHHILNITLQFPSLALPVLVTVLLSAKTNAWFYVAWMIVNLIFYIPVALTMVLHAMNSAQPSRLAHKARATIGLALITSLLVVCLLQVATKHMLSLFGNSYAEQATLILRILVLAAFPLVIKNHYISICRIYDRQKSAMLLIAPGCLLELGAAALGAHVGGLPGLGIGWITAVYIESMFMLRTVYQAIWKASPLSEEQSFPAPETVWLLETSPLPVIGRFYEETEALWLVDTFVLPTVRLPTRVRAAREPKE
jgi:O-antigen/teichoic acid export membrane protein